MVRTIDRFKPDAAQYSVKNALFLAEASSLAYAEPATIQAATLTWGMDRFQFFNDAPIDTQAFLTGNPARRLGRP